MEFKESDVKNLIAIGYLSGVVDAFGKSMNITPDDMKSRMMKSNTIRTTLVDDLSNIDAVELVKSGKNIASGVLSGHSTTTTSEPHSDSLFQKAEHAIEGLFHREPTHEEHHEVMPEEHHEVPVLEPVTPVLEPVTPVLEPVTPVLEPVTPVLEPVTPVLEPVTPVLEPVSPITPNASVIHPMNQAAPPAPYTPTPNVIGGRKKNKSKKRKTKKVKKTRK